jgi:hypothetical protein
MNAHTFPLSTKEAASAVSRFPRLSAAEKAAKAEANRVIWREIIAEMNLKPGITGDVYRGQESPYRHGGR